MQAHGPCKASFYFGLLISSSFCGAALGTSVLEPKAGASSTVIGDNSRKISRHVSSRALFSRPNFNTTNAIRRAFSDTCVRRLATEIPAEMTSGGQTLVEPHKFDLNTATCMLDLDETCIWRNDGADLGIAVQCTGRSNQELNRLYEILINPALRPSYERYVQACVGNVQPIIYTARISLLLYASEFHPEPIALKYAPRWYVGDDLVIPSELRSADEVLATYCGPPLRPEESADTREALERLLAARAAVRAALGLPRPPVVVVTAHAKDAHRLAERLGLPPARAWLFDDNPSLAGQEGVVTIPPYRSLPPPAAARLREFLDTTLPPARLGEEVRAFLSSAPPEDRVLTYDQAAREWRWELPVGPEPDLWPLPPGLTCGPRDPAPAPAPAGAGLG